MLILMTSADDIRNTNIVLGGQDQRRRVQKGVVGGQTQLNTAQRLRENRARHAIDARQTPLPGRADESGFARNGRTMEVQQLRGKKKFAHREDLFFYNVRSIITDSLHTARPRRRPRTKLQANTSTLKVLVLLVRNFSTAPSQFGCT